MALVRRQAGPLPPALGAQEHLLVECDVMRKHGADGPSPCVGENRQGLALTLAGDELRQVFWGWLVVLEKEPRCFRERSLAMGVADLLAAGAVAFTIRFLRTLDQAAVGDKRLDPGEAGDRLDLIQHHQD
jgi:hypothetical protein